jgi:serine/threonine-protein kinase
MRITLTVTSGPHVGETFTFVGHDTFLVGRSRRSRFRLSGLDRYFSRIHFMVEANPPLCRLTDMGSRNGTFVNGVRVLMCDLVDGDQIKAGHTILHVRVEDVEVEVNTSGTFVLAEASLAPPEKTPVALRKSILQSIPLRIGEQSIIPLAEGLLTCVVCGAPLQSTPGTVALTRKGLEALCLVCQELARAQAQPFPGYQLIRELGRGSLGTVHLALHAPTGELVALKVIVPGKPASPVLIERFLFEADRLRRLDHPNLVSMRDLGAAESQIFIATDYIAGMDVDRWLKTKGPMPFPHAVGLACQALEALEYAHAKRLVHFAVRPSNFLIVKEADYELTKLTDFGLARVYQASPLSGLTMSEEMSDRAAFLAPEQITHYREPSAATDQYGVAATLYTMLTGQLIFDLAGQYPEQLSQALLEEPVPIERRNADLPPRLAAIIHRALAKKPARRFADVRAFRKALAVFADE